ncbi:UNVERIFIED_CONTAM: putative AC transposase [Sesamum radiatum]|uniref:AC transposase n=1 Tax=Sesamum radiatum TaxID=300843 RepID=A0AAW2TUV3_SESRA
MARDILAIPISIVASKHAVSISGKLINPHRNRLHLTIVEALMCSRCWLWNKTKGRIGLSRVGAGRARVETSGSGWLVSGWGGVRQGNEVAWVSGSVGLVPNPARVIRVG